jgi:hypothetical protein
MTERTGRMSHRDTETQSNLDLGVSVSLWLLSLCDLCSLRVLAGEKR